MTFLAALAFLTRIPVPAGVERSMARVSAGQAWFPAVGLIIGLILLGVDEAAGRALPRTSVDALLVVALVVITGGLHLDGLSDAADGLLGGDTPKRRLAIMRDVRTGTFGVVAIVSVLLLKWAGFQSLPGGVRAEAIVLTPCLARAAIPLSAAVFPAARPEGLAAALAARSRASVALAGAAATIASVALLGAGGAYLLVCSGACALAIGWSATRLAGGVTGDVHGATIETTEATALLFIGALAHRGWVDAWAFA
jgi:adenosylcobinamide-GDP ribazoletransferase